MAKKNTTKSTKKGNSRVRTIVCFAVGILFLAFTFIPGENVWNIVHNFILSVFSFSSIIFGGGIIYISVMIAKEEENSKIIFKSIVVVIFALMLSSVVQIIMNAAILQDGFATAISYLYTGGAALKTAGVVSAILGWPLVNLFGITGAMIILVIVLFTIIMVVSGATLLEFINGMKKPVEKTAQAYTAAIEKIDERKASRIDIPLDGDAPKKKKKTSNIDIPIPNAKNNFDVPIDDVPIIVNEDIEEPKIQMWQPIEEPGKQIDFEEVVKEATTEIAENLESDVEGYNFPPIDLLKHGKKLKNNEVAAELQQNATLLEETLKSFGVSIKITDISRGPTVTRYELQPAAGVKISKITNLADDIALSLATSGVRIEAPIPNKAAVGIEVPNKLNNIVKLREIIESATFKNAKSNLSFAVGKDIAGEMVIGDIAKMPHMLVAGATGSGKSVCINSIIVSLLYKSSPDDVKLLMVDPKVVELGVYNGIPHLLVPVVTDPKKAAGALGWAVTQMLDRYKLFAEHKVRDIAGYNKYAEKTEGVKKMPHVVIIIDELADLMMASPSEVEDSICRLAQMARAAGMHLIIATQRPSVDVITGIIKANIPSRIAFAVSSGVDSRVILDGSGAEKLLGKGDMLYYPLGTAKPIRVQGCFVNDAEVESVIKFIKNNGEVEYDDSVMEEIEKQAVTGKKTATGGGGFDAEDEMIESAIECLVEAGQASTSFLQRRLKLGYARAARIIDELEQRGIVGPSEGSKPRQVLMTRQQWIEMKLSKENEQEV